MDYAADNARPAEALMQHADALEAEGQMQASS